MTTIDLAEYRARRKALLTNIRVARMFGDSWLDHLRSRLVVIRAAYRA